MKPHDVLGVDGNGRLLVDFGIEIRRYKLQVTATGGLRAVSDFDPPVDGIDQLGERQGTSIARRLAEIDQA